jgi:phosphoribosylamine--glycine ligase
VTQDSGSVAADQSDLVELLFAAGKGRLKNVSIETENQYAVTLSMVSGGYPGDYEKGKEIQGLEKSSNAIFFHAGTKRKDQKILTDGGRVISATGLGNSLDTARAKAYEGASQLHWEGLYYRKDIGQDLLTLKA